VAVVQTEEELQAHLVHCRRPAADFVVQQFLEGQEYTVTIVADHTGVLRAVVPVKVARKRGITLRAATDRDDAVINACVAIHTAFPVSGCFNIQMVKIRTGAVQPFEINPRISTTTCLALAAGVSFVDLYLGGLAAAADARGLAVFRDHLQLRRSWTNEFLDAAGGAIA
jgi:carbamoyl-phosphate synthase large subunit